MGVGRLRDGQPHLVLLSRDPSGFVTDRLWSRCSNSTNKSAWRESPWLPLPPLALPHYPPQVPPASATASISQDGSDLPHTLGLNLQTFTVTISRAELLRFYIPWKCHTIQEWLNEIGAQSISGVTTNERKVKENRPDRGIVMLNWTPYLGIGQVTQTFLFVIRDIVIVVREIERCVIFHHIQLTWL